MNDFDADRDWEAERKKEVQRQEDLRGYQRLVAFFAAPADRQQELLQDFPEQRSFDANGGSYSTIYPLMPALYSLSEWTQRFTSSNYQGMDRPDFIGILRLAQWMSDTWPYPASHGQWSNSEWSVDHLSDSGEWSILRSLCASALHKLPSGPPLEQGEIADLLNYF
jgi:hypothetical protein